MHVQTTPAASWVIPHQLGTYPDVVLLPDSSGPGERVYTDVVYLDGDTLTVDWPSAESGRAYLR